MGDQDKSSSKKNQSQLSSSSLRIITNLEEPAKGTTTKGNNKKRVYVQDSEEEEEAEDYLYTSDSEDENANSRRAAARSSQDQLPTPGRKSRKRSKVWKCFERGEYSKSAHRFTAYCKYCKKKFDGRVAKLKIHILECSQIDAETKLRCSQEDDESEESEPEAEIEKHESAVTPSRRGRPASKLWECFDRGEYSKSAHRFSAICKYCNAGVDGRKGKLKAHILSCSDIDEDTREIYRAVKVDEPAPTPKKPKVDAFTPKGKGSKHQQQQQQPNSDSEPDDPLLFPTHNFVISGNVPSSAFQFAGTSEPYDFLLRFFIENSIPLSSFSSSNLNQFITSLNPQFPTLHHNTQDILDLITRNYNLLKQQEINVLKNENFVTLIFHGEENENTKNLNYFTSIMLKNYYVYNIHAFNLINKNEVHFFSNRWRQAIQNNGKAVAILCDTEENFKLANDWISHSTDVSFHRIVVLRSFNHLLVEMVSSILGHPWITPILSDAITLVKTVHTLRLNNPSPAPVRSSSSQAKKYEQLLEELNHKLIPVVRNQFLSILLMIESIVHNETGLLELKTYLHGSSVLQSPAHNNQNFLNQHHQITNLLNLLNATKFWTTTKLLYILCKPFLDILYQLENVNNTEFISLAETTAYWIYLTNQLESSLLNSGYPEDFRQYVVNIYNSKMELNNFLIHDAYKLALFLSPKYISGLHLQKEPFFKSLLKFSCTYIQNYGYHEQDCSKLISQMVTYRNQHLAIQATGNPTISPMKNRNVNIDTNDLKEYWESYSPHVTTGNNGKEVYQIIQTVAFLLLDIIPYIKGRGSRSSLFLNGQLNKLANYENFFPELSNEMNNSQIISMIETIRVHEFFACATKTELHKQQSNNQSAFNFDHMEQDQTTSFDNNLVDRFELTTLLESFYRRDIAALIKISEIGAHESLMKVDGINYQHPCFMLADKFQKRNEVNISFQGQQSGGFHTNNGPSSSKNNKSDPGFDIDALIDLAYNS